VTIHTEWDDGDPDDLEGEAFRTRRQPGSPGP
jgi:hypothetical protein